MNSIEALFVALIIIFTIFRGIYSMLKAATAAVRRALGVGSVAGTARRREMEQIVQQAPSQPETAQIPRKAPRPEVRQRAELRPRRPEAGGPAVTDTPTDTRFREQVAQIEASEEAGLSATDIGGVQGNPLPMAPRLELGRDDLLRAVILQEILGKPLSKRRPMPSASQPSPHSSQ